MGSSRTKDGTRAPAVEAWWLNQWIAREVQTSLLGIMVGTFLVVQRLRLCLAMQVVQF